MAFTAPPAMGTPPDRESLGANENDFRIKINEYFNDIWNFWTWLGSFVVEMTSATDQITADKQYISDAVTHVDSVVNSTYGGVWNATDDFTNKTTMYNGVLFLGLSPTVGIPPVDDKVTWTSLGEVKNKVYVSSDYSAKDKDVVYVGTLNSIVNITLPTKEDGLVVEIIDRDLSFDINNCIVIDSDGDNIDLITDGTNLELTIKGLKIKLEVVKASDNSLKWRLV